MVLSPMNIAVLGPGGVGGLLAALLAQASNQVTVLASEASSRAIADHGLRVESRKLGDFTVHVRTATRLEPPVDACLVTVKATHLEEALKRMPAETVGDALVVPFLNGIDHVVLLRGIYPPASVAPATIRVETARTGPGLIRQTSPFVIVEIAASPDNRDRVERLAAHLREARLDVHVRDDELAMLWDKLAMLAPLALLTTHERAGAGVIRTRRREDTLAVIHEVAAVARAEGMKVDPEAAIKMLDSAPEAMGSSMQRDQADGRPLELDAIGGVLVRRAARAGVAVPVTERLVAELRARTAGQ